MPTRLVGAHQARNAAVAAELLAIAPEEVRPAWEDVEAGFAAVRWAGRLQVERIGGATWVFDVAHNAAGVDSLVSALAAIDLPKPVVLLTAILNDKAWDEMLPPLLAHADAAVFTVAPSSPESRRWDAAAAAERMGESTRVLIRVIPDFAAALQRVQTMAPYGTVLVTGSVHTVGDALGELGVPRV